MGAASIKTFVMIALLLFAGFKAKAQYNFIARQLVSNGQVKAVKQKWRFKNTYKDGIYYSKLASSEFPIAYIYDGNCGKFEIKSRVFELNEYFEDGLACDLDLSVPEMYQFYKFSFENKKYIVLQCINNGSRTSFILIHLFQINKNSVSYYPLWSRYGSIACLGDFNKDRILEFLKIRNNERQTGIDTFKVTLVSLDSSKVLHQNKEWYFKKVYTTNNDIQTKTIKPLR